MASKSVATTPVEVARELFGEHPEDVLGIIDSGSDRLSQLSSLFRAIGEKADKHSDIWQLAGLGEYVASDAANFMDCQHETYRDNMAAAIAKGG